MSFRKRPAEEYPKAWLKRVKMPGVGTGNNPSGWKGVQPNHGESNGRAVLTAKKVKMIRKRARLGWRTETLSEQYGVTCTQIRRIVTKQNWKKMR